MLFLLTFSKYQVFIFLNSFSTLYFSNFCSHLYYFLCHFVLGLQYSSVANFSVWNENEITHFTSFFFSIISIFLELWISLLNTALASSYKIKIFFFIKIQSKICSRASLVAQWLRILLPMQGTWVWALVGEDPTCRRATKLMCHNYWACALEPACHNCWAHVPQLLKPACLEPLLHNRRSHRSEKPAHRNEE